MLLGNFCTTISLLFEEMNVANLKDTFSSWTGITENAERQIRHNCTPLQIVHRIPNVENKNEAL